MAIRITAKHYFPTPRSTWCYAIIQTCDDLFAIQFKKRLRTGGYVPTVCCLYPKVIGPTYYLSCVSHYSKGKFVWYWLPYHQPYQIVLPPIQPFTCGSQTTCCTALIPNDLHASFTNGPACLNGLSQGITKGILSSWTGQTAIDVCGQSAGSMGVDLGCAVGIGWSMNLIGDVSGNAFGATTLTCPESGALSIYFKGIAITGYDLSNLGTVDVTVTV